MITLDTRELEALAKGMKRYGGIFPPAQVSSALRRSAQPMLRAARSLAPVGSNGAERISLKHRKISNPNEYRRGGATRRDMRIKTVNGVGGEITRVLIGVSQKRGKVGWRTHFITRGFTDRAGKAHSGKDFLDAAYNQTIDVVKDGFYRYLFTNYIKWGKANLPQRSI